MRTSTFCVSIPEHCHENWDQMKQEDQGRFCFSCNKSVIDFSKMNEQEIGDFFKNSTGEKVCGRFRTEQLNKPLSYTVDLDSLPRNMSISGIFALALLMVFGTGLISCYDHHKNKISQAEWQANKKNKDVQNKDVRMVLGQSDFSDFIYHESKIVDKEEKTDGCVSPQSEEDQEDYVTYMKGKPKFRIHGDAPEATEVTDSVLAISSDNKYTLGGSVAFVCVEADDAEAIESSESDQKLAGENRWIVFPNPANTFLTIDYYLDKPGMAKIELLNEKGELVRSIENGVQTEGNHESIVNVEDLARGIYLLSRFIDGKKEVKKVILE